MRALDSDNPYLKELIGLVNDISRQVPIDMEDKVLIALVLNSEAKIKKYAQWVKTRLDGEILHATAPEIVRAAVKIGKEG